MPYIGMSSDPNIKTVRLTAGAVGGATDGVSRKKSKGGSNRKTLKIDRMEEGGGSTSPGTIVQLTASSNPGDPKLPAPVGRNSELTGKGVPIQEAGKSTEKKEDTPVKVVLAAPKKKGHVILAAAKQPAGAAAAAAAAGKTRKVMRSKKVRMTISCLGKKIHKAKEIRKAATESTLDEVKRTLNKANLIKKDSKAPETMLRQMYADYMTLKGRAL